MDFYAVLDQVLACCASGGGVTNNVLKRQFGLNDACLQDLKDESTGGHSPLLARPYRGGGLDGGASSTA